jgi:hypothetical protein
LIGIGKLSWPESRDSFFVQNKWSNVDFKRLLNKVVLAHRWMADLRSGLGIEKASVKFDKDRTWLLKRENKTAFANKKKISPFSLINIIRRGSELNPGNQLVDFLFYFGTPDR